ncbi:ribosomal protection-like ABC-F family protein [Mucilaginibacter celer]|uniref:ATP-binding cassette domain-containing protein n=1 Tax=Mucilaginibacter celer TaxID=2305508 RepID=A0A494VUF4_9SPHI|nr:ABC-F family ATP-binding cassette domain-containing protein [Mucilaginibacter celer]AYL97999.1 ATP-binding cassette domain-containing protein [Mucilaginibacter celer]
MLTAQGLAYVHPNRDLLFSDLDLTINKNDKAALVGNNGAGKSILLNILAGNLKPAAGLVKTSSKPYYVPQLTDRFNEHTIAEALGINHKLKALHEILNGNVTDEYLTNLNDDWVIEERYREALTHWGLDNIAASQKMGTLSGGQKTKVLLAGITIHQPEIVLLDEPSNHLDSRSRELLYNYIINTKNTLVVVSHDRALLNLLNPVYELSKRGIIVYGGNYDFYAEQKTIATGALSQDVKSKEKALRKAKEVEREAMERQQKLDARGKKKQEKAGVARIMMNTMRNNAEKSTSRVQDVHAEKVGAISQQLSQLRSSLPDADKMKMDFDNSGLHNGKVLITVQDANFKYQDNLLWQQNLNFQITSGKRMAIRGQNGSGKTTLIKMLLGKLQPVIGLVDSANVKSVYIDQDYSLINPAFKVYDQAQYFNSGTLQEHEIKIRLNRFLFTREDWDKPCGALSGGEKMRLALCCLAIGNQAPDVIILDEPTNNLDLQNIAILTSAINDYRGTLIVISHDEYFLKQVGIEDAVVLE